MTKVLVFESDTAFAESLVAGLSNYGCSTQVVDDGEAGIAAAEQNKPDLILLSIELPRMNGFSVCNKLKRSGDLKDVPLILLSSEATDETFEQHKRLRTRAEDYIHKPITIEELVQRIQPFVQLTGAEPAEIDFDDVEVEEEVEEIEADDMDAETDEAFGNLLAPASVAPSVPPPAPSSVARVEETVAVSPVEEPEESPPAPVEEPSALRAEELHLEELELDESDGLEVAESEPAPRLEEENLEEAIESVHSVSAHAVAAFAAAPVGVGAGAELVEELKRNQEAQARLERALREAERAHSDLADSKAQQEKKQKAELELLQREIDELKSKLSSNSGGGTAREFLDLREQLNRKDKEILDVRDQLTSREKEVVKLNDSNISLEREQADLSDKIRELSTLNTGLERLRDSLSDDKAQANKRADDFKAKSERLYEELEAKGLELKQAAESHLNALAARDAAELALREEHQKQLEQAATEAIEVQRRAVELAVAQTEEQALAAREVALAEAATLAEQAQQSALAAREAELSSEHDSKMAALHRSNEESLRKLKAEQAQATQEAEQAALGRLEERERELAEEQAQALAAQKLDHDTAYAQLSEAKAKSESERDAVIAGLESSLTARTEERDTAQATIVERDAVIAGLESSLTARTEERDTAQATIVERDAAIVGLETELTARTEERDRAQTTVVERETRITQLEVDLAKTRAELVETTDRKNDVAQKLSLARTKWVSDSAAIEKIKAALVEATSELDAALNRPLE